MPAVSHNGVFRSLRMILQAAAAAAAAVVVAVASAAVVVAAAVARPADSKQPWQCTACCKNTATCID